jgi:hypothetical protein
MTWLQRYRLRHFLQFSFWVAPVGGMGVALIVRRAVLWLDFTADEDIEWEAQARGARASYRG